MTEQKFNDMKLKDILEYINEQEAMIIAYKARNAELKKFADSLAEVKDTSIKVLSNHSPCA